MGQTVGPIDQDKAVKTRPPSFGKDCLELAPFAEPAIPTKGLGGRLVAQGVNRARPLARRAFKTLRPLRVAIRARKPWVRARLMRLG